MDSTLSLKDIAAAAGVTRTTVSLALRRHPRISEATAERIRRLARDMGYWLDAHLTRGMSGLRQGRRAAALWTVALVRAEPLRSPEVEQARAVARELGLSLDLLTVGTERMSASRLNQILETRGTEGAILDLPGAIRFLRSLALERLCACSRSADLSFLHRVVGGTESERIEVALEWMETLLRRQQRGVPSRPLQVVLPGE